MGETHARSKSSKILITAVGTLNKTEKCIKLAVGTVSVKLEQVTIHDTSVKIDLGPIPGVNIGKLADLIAGVAPQITDAISKAVDKPISDAIKNAIPKISCIKIPLPPSEDVMVV